MDNSKTPDLFSPDGYIVKQRNAVGFPYGRFSSDFNGCGWIAVYNLLLSLDRAPTPEALCKQMSDLLPVKGFGGTPIAVMQDFLTSLGIDFTRGDGRKAALRLGTASERGILRYWEWPSPHFVFYLRQPDGKYRFFNINDDLDEITISFARFLKERPALPLIRILAV